MVEDVSTSQINNISEGSGLSRMIHLSEKEHVCPFAMTSFETPRLPSKFSSSILFAVARVSAAMLTRFCS
jgi:hypothetical protein